MPLVEAMLDCDYRSRQATYDLRRLARNGLIARIDGTHHYELTPLGRRVAVLFTKTSGAARSGPCCAEPPSSAPVERAQPARNRMRKLDQVLDDFMDRQMIAA